MTEATRNTLGKTVLIITFALLAVAIGGMTGVIPKWVPSRELIMLCLVLSVLARSLMRKRTQS